jgi:hypothetical protein
VIVRELPAALGQRLLWLMAHYRGANGGLNTVMSVRLSGAFDAGAWSAAVDALTARHEALRTTFGGRGRNLRQFVHAPRAVTVNAEDLAGVPDPEAALRQRLAADARGPIDPSDWPARYSVWRLADDEHVLSLNIHHLVNDAWSYDVIWRDLCRAYNGPGTGDLAAPQWQFADFAAWQAAEVAVGPRFAELETHWRERLDGARFPRPPGSDEADPAVPRIGAAASVTLPPDVVSGLTQLGRKRRATVFSVLLAAFYGVLREFTGQDDLSVGSLYANRARAEARETVGFLANLLPVRVRIPAAATFADALAEVRAATLEAFLHQDLPYQVFRLNSQLGPDSVVFNPHARSPGDDPAVRFGGATAEWLPPDPMACRFDLEFRLVPEAGRMRGTLFYNQALVPAAVAGDFADAYGRLCAACLARPDAVLSTLL